MTKTKTQWSEQEQMMAGAYANIASSFSQITAYMKNHLKTVKNGGGIITDGDVEEVISMLSGMINKNLHNASQKRISITVNSITPQSTVFLEPSAQHSSLQSESKKNMNTIKLTESQLKKVIAESVKRVLKEIKINPQNYIIVNAWDNMHGNTFSDIYEKYGDAVVHTDYCDFFILPQNELSYLQLLPNIEIYKIPKQYQTLDEVEEDLQNGVLDYENGELQRIK